MKKTMILALSLTAIFAFCAIALAGTPVPGEPAWDPAYRAMLVGEPALEPSVSGRTNASGDKITSNAHSGDIPGLYFYWDDKQKDDGVLLVADDFFNWFKDEASFFVTAKNSNAYWDYQIVKGEGLTVAPGVSAYKIPRFFMYCETDKKTGAIVTDKKTGLPVMVKDELKNINMVFIDGDYKDAQLTIVKVWLDEEGNIIAGDDSLVLLNAPYELGVNVITVDSLLGKNVTVTEQPIEGFTALKNPLSAKVLPGGSATVTFENQKQYASITIVKVWLAICECDEADCNGLAEIDAPVLYGVKATFTDPFALGVNTVKAGEYIISEDEIEPVDTGDAIVYFGLEKVEIDGVEIDPFDWLDDNGPTIAVNGGEKTTVTYYNLVSVEPKAAPEVRVQKIWLDWEGIEIDLNNLAFAVSAPDFDSNFDYELNSNIPSPLIAGYDYYIREILDPDWFYDDGAYVYEIEFVSVSGGDIVEGETAIISIAEHDREYAIVFTNQIVRTPKNNPTGIYDAIPSHTHADRWWNNAKLGFNYWILCYAGNTTDEGQYFIFLGDAFFEKYESVTVGFGTKNNFVQTITFTKDDLEYRDSMVYANGTHYTEPTNTKNYDFGPGYFTWFDNPHGTGAMQAWLISVQ